MLCALTSNMESVKKKKTCEIHGNRISVSEDRE